MDFKQMPESDLKPTEKRQLKRKRKSSAEDTFAEDDVIPIKRVRKSTGQKRKAYVQNHQQSKRKKNVKLGAFLNEVLSEIKMS